ncbi:MAG: hypothetical protein O3C21_01425, partial [Verrucomicrobia bacterium]|nr:hypothetical protein [Verrucomicrobiota bacterium]
AAMAFRVVRSTGGELFESLSIQSGKLSIVGRAGSYGTAQLTVMAADKEGLFATTSFYVHVHTGKKPEKLPLVKRDEDGRPLVKLEPKTDPRPKHPTPDDPDDTSQIDFEFESDPGREYCLERADNLQGPWGRVTKVIALTPVTVITDIIPAGRKELFWRLCIEDVSGNDPFEVTDFDAAPYFNGDDRGALIEIAAASGPGIEAVNVYNDDKLLGPAENVADGLWSFRIPLADSRPQIYHLRAEVIDANDHTAITEIERVFLADPLKFVPYNPGTGEELTGAFVQLLTDEQLSPFLYRQAGGGDPLNTLTFEFPNGASVLFTKGESFIEFGQARAYFNNDVTSAFVTRGGAGRLLPLGDIPQSTFASIFGLNPLDGIPFKLWGLVPIVWTGGVLTEFQIRGAQLRIPKETLPLPPFSIADATRYLDGEEGPALTLAYHGSFQIPGGPTVRVAENNPLTLTIRPDDTYALSAAVEVEFDNGARFKGWLSFDDPVYQFTIRATGITIPLLSSLADTLPDNPAACIAQQTLTNAQLSQAALCLESFRKTYTNFSITASAELPLAVNDDSPTFAPTTGATVTSLINAWGFRMAAVANTVVDVTEIAALKKLLEQLGQSAIDSGELPLVTEHVSALIRAKIGLELARRNGGNVTSLTTELNEALAKANTAAVTIADSSDAIATVDALDRVLEHLADTATAIEEAQGQGIGITLQPELLGAMKKVIERAVADRVTALGVQPGVFIGAASSPINQMNRHLARKKVSEFVRIFRHVAIAEKFGISLAGFPFLEGASQLMHRHQDQLAIDASDALLRGDLRSIYAVLE